MSKKPNSAWERRNLYAKQLQERNASTRNKTALETEKNNSQASDIGENNANSLGISMQPLKTKLVPKNKIAIPTAAKVTRRAAGTMLPSSMDNKQQSMGTVSMARLKTTNNARNSKKITMDPTLFKFTAKPVTLPVRKSAVIKKAQTMPSSKPNKRISITKKSPALSILKHTSKKSKYVVPSKIDTGLRKKITQKIKITPKECTESAAAVSLVDLNNPQPGTSKHLDAPTKPKETPAVSAKSWSKKRKISFGKITPLKTALRKKSTPVTNPTKKPKIVVMSEMKLKNDKDKIMHFGKEVQNYERWVKERQDNDQDIDKDNEVFEDALITTPVNAQPLKKRSKSVSFKVPDSVCKTPLVLPRTPGTKSSLRKKLEDFAETKGLNTAYIRHLHCLGKELSEVKRNKALKRTKSSTPNLKIRSAPTPSTPRASSPIQTNHQDLLKALKELKQVIDSGLDLQQAADWLKDIEDFYPQFQKLAMYWELKALLLEKNNDFAGALDVFGQAADKIDEEDSEVLQATVTSFMDRISSKTVTEVSVDDKENEGSSRKRKTARKTIDCTLNMDTNIVKFVNAKNSSTAKRLFKSCATPNEISSILTPVRRSARLASASKSTIDLEEMEPEQLSKVIFLPNSFL